MLGAGSVALGAALLALIFAMGKWGFFWIFLWVFMALFGNGVRQFNKGWNKWSEASVELKATGYAKPPSTLSENKPPNPSRLRENDSRPRQLPLVPAPPASRDYEPPSSVTESTTRHLNTHDTKQ